MFQASITGVVNDETVTELIGDPVESVRVAWTALADKLDDEYTAITADDSLVGSGRLDLLELNDIRWEAVHGTSWEAPGEVTIDPTVDYPVGRTYKVESIPDPSDYEIYDPAE